MNQYLDNYLHVVPKTESHNQSLVVYVVKIFHFFIFTSGVTGYNLFYGKEIPLTLNKSVVLTTN